MKRYWSEGGNDKPYSVTLWHDTPCETDTCSMGADFATEKEARMCLADLGAHFSYVSTTGVPYILLDGPGVHEVTCRTEYLLISKRQELRDQQAARSELAMQAGMGMGVAAYNEALGYDSEPYDPSIDSKY